MICTVRRFSRLVAISFTCGFQKFFNLPMDGGKYVLSNVVDGFLQATFLKSISGGIV